MLFNLIDKRIRKAFSEAAMHYDMLTSLHKEIGRELVRKMADVERCDRVLDVGMGTGNFTRRLTRMFPDAAVVGLDFSSGMIEEAKKGEPAFRIVQADAAQLPFKDGIFDIVTSNLAYQWIADLPKALALCHAGLRDKGLLCLTMFGHDTFQELFEAMSAVAGKRSIGHRLADRDEVEAALAQAGFHDCIVSSERIKVRFEDMLNLVRWIRDIGANAVPKDIYLGKELLLEINHYYNTHFCDRLGVFATFEVIWIEAKK